METTDDGTPACQNEHQYKTARARMETNQAKLMARWEGNRKKKADFKKIMAEQKADQEKREAERKVDQEVATRLEAIHDKTDTS
jgi:transposase